MLLYRTGPQGFYVATDPDGEPRALFSDPLQDPPSQWRFGRRVDLHLSPLLPPIVPGKILGIGRNYAAHADELGNPRPDEPVMFLKAPSSLIGPKTPIILPPESERIEHEGEIAIVLKRTLRRANEAECRAAILGITAACDVTARDLQRRDPTFARAKSFDTFCPLGPAILVDAEIDGLEVVTRVNGEVRQHGRSREMIFSILELLLYASRMMTLEAGDIILTGSPAGVGPLLPGDCVEVEIDGVGVLENPVEAWREGRFEEPGEVLHDEV